MIKRTYEGKENLEIFTSRTYFLVNGDLGFIHIHTSCLILLELRAPSTKSGGGISFETRQDTKSKRDKPAGTDAGAESEPKPDDTPSNTK